MSISNAIPAMQRLLLAAAVLSSGCASSLSGRVVDADGRAIPGAAVDARFFHSGFLIGEASFTVHTTADAEGRFTTKEVSGRPLRIEAASPDGARKGVNTSPSRSGDNLVVVR